MGRPLQIPAAFVGEEAQRGVHGAEFHAADQGGALAFLGHQAGLDQPPDMVGQRGCRNAQPLLKMTDGQPVGTGPHERPEDAQTGDVAKGIEARGQGFQVHDDTVTFATGAVKPYFE